MAANQRIVNSTLTGTDQYSDTIIVERGSSLKYKITNDVGVTAFKIVVEESLDHGATWTQVYKPNTDPVQFTSEINSDTGTLQYNQQALFRFGIPAGGSFTGTGNIYIYLRTG